MDNETSGTIENQDEQTQVDPWIKAFAALEQKSEGDSKEPSDTGASDVPADGELGNADTADGVSGIPAQVEDANGSGDAEQSGGLGSDSGDAPIKSGTAFDGISEFDAESIQRFEQSLNDDIRKQAIDDIAKEFLKRDVRQHDGVLGATLDDDDICKRDSDGVPRFYNPETGREFTGDNPRRQALEWVNDYNQALADAFNKACSQYENHLKQQAAPQLAVMKFAPKYEKLDDIRRGMFDNVIQDYEVKDSDGKVVGYSCDLDKALSLVDRQISMIQDYAKNHQSQQKEQPSGPVLDMKTSSGAVGTANQNAPSSLAEAMEQLQNEQLAKLKKQD